jgi:hypothetical protein
MADRYDVVTEEEPEPVPFDPGPGVSWDVPAEPIDEAAIRQVDEALRRALEGLPCPW